jgi:hypothetical protein
MSNNDQTLGPGDCWCYWIRRPIIGESIFAPIGWTREQIERERALCIDAATKDGIKIGQVQRLFEGRPTGF